MARSSKTGIKGLHKDKRGRWCIDFRYRDPVSRELRRHCEDLPVGISAAAARERARAALNAAYEGRLGRQSPTTIRLHDALARYLEWCETNRPKTLGDRCYLVAVLERHLGNLVLHDLSPFAVEKLKRGRAEEGAAPATVNRAVALLKHFTGLAASWGWLPKTIAADIRAVPLLAEPPGRVRYLSKDEAVTLMRALREDVRAVAVAAILTGMRLGELRGLRKHDVDLETGLITVRRTKTNRLRVIPMHHALAPILRIEMARSSTDYVFTNRCGRPHSHRISHLFREAVSNVGIPNLHFHDLRHDFATKARIAGAGLDVVATLLGHTTLAMTQRYAHLGLPELRSAVDSLRAPETLIEENADGERNI